MEVDQLPTKPGPYYWREKDGDEWALGNVFESYDWEACREQCLYFETFNISRKPLNDMQGQWLPIPTADELVELQAKAKAKAKAYDEGTQQIAVYSEVIWSDNYLNMLEEADLTFGSPKVRVRVCKEVVV